MDPQLESAVDFVYRYCSKFPGEIPTFTDKLTLALVKDFARVPEDKKEMFVEWVRAQYEGLIEQLKPLRNEPDVEVRMREYMEALDDWIEKYKHKDTMCRKGCFGCCMQKVSAAELETEVIAKRIAEGKVSVNMDTLIKQAAVGDYDAGEYQTRLGKQNAVCVFLSNGECSIYDIRPIMCRTYHVVSDPKHCDPFDYPDYTVSVANNMNVEFLVSAIFHEIGAEGNLQQQVLRNLQKVGFPGA